jgi:hypothetical protein
MQCPLKFKFRYLESLPEETLSSSLLFGSGIHQALEEFFRAELAGGPKTTLEKLVYIYRSTWLPADPEAVSLGGSDTRESLDRLAVKVLQAFLASDSAGFWAMCWESRKKFRAYLLRACQTCLAALIWSPKKKTP